MGRWVSFRPTTQEEACSEPETRGSSGRQAIENAGGLVLNTFEQRPCSEDARGEASKTEEFRHSSESQGTFERFEPFEHTKGHRDIYADEEGFRTNEQNQDRYGSPWGLYEKLNSCVSLGGTQGRSKRSERSKALSSSMHPSGPQPYREYDVSPAVLRDGRSMWRFCAGEIPRSPADETAALIERVRRGGVVLIADGMELHIVERWRGQLHPAAVRVLRENAGAAIAVLRGEHQERVSRMQPDQVATHDPHTGARG
jgi:hypothetical protein